MKIRLLILLSFCFALSATATGKLDTLPNPNKLFLGQATDSRGLQSVGGAAPTFRPRNRFYTFTHRDTVAKVTWEWSGFTGKWNAYGDISQALPPVPVTSTYPGYDRRTAKWVDSDDSNEHIYNYVLSAWVPADGIHVSATTPTDVSSGGSNGAAVYTKSLWYDSANSLLKKFNGSAWDNVSSGGGGGDSTAVLRADINNLQSLTGRPDGSTNLGTFTGSTIADNVAIKPALQSLETAVEGKLSSEVDGSTTNEIQNLTYTAGTRTINISSGTGVALPLMSTTNAGLVPATGDGSGLKFLSADGTFKTISGATTPCRDSAYILAPDTLVVKTAYCTVLKFKWVFNLPADSFSVVGNAIYAYRRGSTTPMILNLPAVTPPIVAITGDSTPTVAISTGAIFEINLSGVQSANLDYSNFQSGKTFTVRIINADSIYWPPNMQFVGEDGKQYLFAATKKKNIIFDAYCATDSIVWVKWSSSAMSAYEFSPEYVEVLTKAESINATPPTLRQQYRQDILMRTLVTKGLRAKADIVYVFKNNGSKEFSLIDWKNPSGTNTATAVNAAVWTSNVGWNSDGTGTNPGTNAYINTNYNPGTEAVNYTTNSASIGVWRVNPIASGGRYPLGMSTNRFEGGGAGSTFRGQQNSNSEWVASSAASGSGFALSSRTASTTNAIYFNGINRTLSGGTTLGITPASANMWLMALNLSNSPFGATPSTEKMLYFWMGGGLNSTEQSDLYNALNTYNNAATSFP